MTITRIERLVRKVRAALQTQEMGGAQLAGELAEICREGNQRIEQCLGSLRRGDVGGALDLSESEPPLLEQIRALSFPEFEGWVQRCREMGWAIPETPDQRAFQALQKSFQESRGKEADPALVESYRAAMVAGDRAAALRTLATILRHRPQDGWALGEKAKLLAKESELSLRRLESLLQAGDSQSLAAEVDRFEKLGLDPKQRPEIFEAARHCRTEAQREEALAKVGQWLQQAEALRRTGDWQEVEQILERASGELEESGARPPRGHLWQDLQQWVREKKRHQAHQEDWCKLQAKIDRELDTLEGLRRAKARRSVGRLRESLSQVQEFLGIQEHDGGKCSEGTYRRLRQEAESLAADLRAKKKIRWVWAAAIVVALTLCLVGLLQWKQEEIREQMFAVKILEMVQERKAVEAQGWLESEEAKRAQSKADGAALLAKLRAFLEREQSLRREAEQHLVSLEQSDLSSLEDGWRAWDDMTKRLASVCQEWKTDLGNRSQAVEDRLRLKSSQWKEEQSRKLGIALKQVEEDFESWKKKETSHPKDLARLGAIFDKLSEGEAWSRETREELAMPSSLKEGFHRLQDRINQEKVLSESFHQLRQTLGNATSAEDYRKALEALANHPFFSEPERNLARPVLSSWKKKEDLDQLLWLPWLTAVPPNLVTGAAPLMPDHLSAKEDRLLQEILEDDYFQDLWVYQAPDPKDSSERYTVYAKGQLILKPGDGLKKSYIYGEGDVFIPRECFSEKAVEWQKRPEVKTVMGMVDKQNKLLIGYLGSGPIVPVREKNSEKLKAVLTSLSETLAGNPSPGLGRAPIQTALQKLFSPLPGTSPLARAYLAQKIWELALAGKDPRRFGLIYSPTLQQITVPWSSGEKIEPGLWLKEGGGGTDPEWIQLFCGELRENVLDETKLSASIWRRATKEGLSFCGYCDERGDRKTDGATKPETGQVLLGQGRDGEIILGFRYDGKNWIEKGRVRPLSPLYLLGKSPEVILLESSREAKVDEEWAKGWARKNLPLLFGQRESGGRN